MCDLISRQEALEKGLSRYFTGAPCQRGHTSERYTSSKECCECRYLAGKKYGSKPESKRRACELQRIYSQRRTEDAKVRRAQTRAKWCEANRKRLRELAKLSYERHIEERRKLARRDYEQNAQRYKVKAVNRQLKKRRAMPSWVDKQAISEIYKEAKRLTDLTGIQYHVDHIVPLQGKIVCGLHVPWNLQILTKKENLEKHNKFDENVSDGIKHLNLLRS